MNRRRKKALYARVLSRLRGGFRLYAWSITSPHALLGEATAVLDTVGTLLQGELGHIGSFRLIQTAAAASSV